VNEEALSMISSLEGPIGVISVAGLYRTGKSYLLNRVILNKANGFGVGPTINPCTKGIWVWGKPVKGQSPEGEILNILVIDTEGIGALDEDSNHDVRIFSLAIMLSSCFIYNSVGNIDENAISNLSLVINITKHIHLRSTNKEDVDSDEYAQYFPTFLWVVRDFTLQLVDQEGEPISPKEYLELALQPQKGFSEQVENKNRVRRLIQTFFRERECFTMVRPLTKEKDLQNLDKTDMSKLRPEFVEQVLNLRKKVITKLKPKTFHGKAISGSMFVGLLNNYITAINDGCVPNIESAWHSICHQTTVKARVDAFEEYEEGLKNQLTIKFPISQQDLKVIHEGQKASALESYHRRAMGEDTQPALKDLVNRISERYESIKLENKREFERLLLSTLAQQYGVLDAKLKKGEYRSFSEFDKDLKSFQKYFEDLEPDGPNKAKLISEFLVKKVSDASYSFLKMAQKDSEEQGVHFKETREKLEREALEAKDERMKEKNAMSLRISDLETSKAELEVKYGLVEQAVSELKKEKEKLEETLKIEMKSEREESKKIIDELKEFVSTNESASKRLERDIVFERSEFEKEKALLQQKLSFYEKSHAEYTAKEAGLQSNIQKISAELSAQLKETSTRHEEEQRQSQKQVKMMTERIAELEEAAAKAKVEQEIAREHAREKEAELLKSLEETQKKFLKSQQESSLSASKNRVEAVEEMKRVYEEKMKALQKEFEKADGDSKERDDRIKAMKTAAEKEKALYNQNIQFLEMQLTELRKQMEDQKKIHEVAMKALEGNPSLSKGEVSKQISELKELHKKEKSQLEGELENTRKRLTMEIVSLHDKQEELEKKSEEENKKWRETQRKLKSDLEAISDERDKLKEQCLEAEATKHKVVSEAEKRFAARILTLEEELERTKDKNAEEVEAMQSASEESLRQLKAFYEGEKLRLEKKIQTEKEKQEKRFNTMVEEYEAKAQEDQREHEEEIENMQEEMKELEIQNMATIQHLEQEVTLKQQELEMAEKQLKEIRDAYESLQINSQASLDQLTSNFAEERRGLNRKIEVLSGEMNNKERELFALNKSKEAVEQALNKKETQLLECKAAFEVEKKEMDKKVEDARSSLQRVSDEFMEQKIQYGKEVALASQQVFFALSSLNFYGVFLGRMSL
jgi:Guanylate-binding protein, N-terminal domain/Guanylate-binding protein, C-terminal domain